MELLTILFPFALVALIFGGIIFLAVRRGLEMKELVEQGVETQGTVINKRSVTAPRASSRQQKLAYRYTDSQGGSHEHTSIMTYGDYDQYEVGQPIAVVYSAKRPGVSAAKFMVDLARETMKKK